MAVALLCTPAFIRFLVRRSYGQFIRDDLTHHHVKRGKPTMGGAVIIGAALVGYLTSHGALLVLGATGVAGVSPGRISLSALPVLLLPAGPGVAGSLAGFTKVRRP